MNHIMALMSILSIQTDECNSAMKAGIENERVLIITF